MSPRLPRVLVEESYRGLLRVLPGHELHEEAW